MRGKLLVVDDESDLRKVLSRAFGEAYEVLEASNGPDALRVIRESRPRVMLLDIVMPGMNGLEVLAAARELDGALTVIMLTSESEVDTAKRALELGAAEYVTKPFDLEFLRGEVRRYMAPPPEGGAPEDPPPWRVVL